MDTWPPALTRDEHQNIAVEWLNAPTKTLRKQHFKSHGIRYSSLLRLRYWEPSLWTINEGMHILLLGIIPRHCRELLMLNIKDLPSEEDDVEIPPKAMRHAREMLGRQTKSALGSLSMNVLKALCVELDIVVPPPVKGKRRKDEYITALLVRCVCY